MSQCDTVTEQNAAVPLRQVKSAIGFAASLAAVCCQIFLLATIALAPLSVAANPLGHVPICHADDGTQPGQSTPNRPAHDPAHDCALCVLCLSHASPLAMLSPPPVALPARHVIAIARPVAAQPRAPPVRLVASAQPRGPPSLI
jgi:hypothetical protein